MKGNVYSLKYIEFGRLHKLQIVHLPFLDFCEGSPAIQFCFLPKPFEVGLGGSRAVVPLPSLEQDAVYQEALGWRFWCKVLD